LAGEVGVGKPRLVAEAKVWANQTGLLNLLGECFVPDRVLPYATTNSPSWHRFRDPDRSEEFIYLRGDCFVEKSTLPATT